VPELFPLNSRVELADSFHAYATELGFSGVLALFERGELVLQGAFGFRDISNGTANSGDTRFGIASGTKLFTALGILRLVEGGEITLSTTASSLFDKPPSYIDASATIEDLLCHRSGIFDYYDEELIEDFDTFEVSIPWHKLETPSDYLPLFESQNPKSAPGEQTSYSNGGFVFLGIIIEKLTGERYRDFIKREILDRAGMGRSGFYAFNELPPDTAFGYIVDGDHYRTNIYQLPIRGGGDGGMYTTARDMYKLWGTLFRGELLDEELLTAMTAPHSRPWDAIDYGLGVYLPSVLGHPAYAITGSDAGVGFSSRYIPSLDLQYSVLSNRTDGNVEVAKRLGDRVETAIRART
jgi:CubicO group peptidase (beta-lactamase class C family)